MVQHWGKALPQESLCLCKELKAAHTWAGGQEGRFWAQQAITEPLTGLLHTPCLADRSLWHGSHRQHDKAAPQLWLSLPEAAGDSSFTPQQETLLGLSKTPAAAKLPAGEVPWLPHVRVQHQAAMLREQNLGPSDEVKMYLTEHEGATKHFKLCLQAKTHQASGTRESRTRMVLRAAHLCL